MQTLNIVGNERYILPYPTELKRRVGATDFGRKTLYCPGTYPVKTVPLSPEQFGIRRASRKMHNRTNYR